MRNIVVRLKCNGHYLIGKNFAGATFYPEMLKTAPEAFLFALNSHFRPDELYFERVEDVEK